MEVGDKKRLILSCGVGVKRLKKATPFGRAGMGRKRTGKKWVGKNRV